MYVKHIRDYSVVDTFPANPNHYRYSPLRYKGTMRRFIVNSIDMSAFLNTSMLVSIKRRALSPHANIRYTIDAPMEYKRMLFFNIKW